MELTRESGINIFVWKLRKYFVHTLLGGVSLKGGVGICWGLTEGGNGLCLSHFPSISFHLHDHYAQTRAHTYTQKGIPQSLRRVWDRSLFASHSNLVYDSHPLSPDFTQELTFFLKGRSVTILFLLYSFPVYSGFGGCLYLTPTSHCSFPCWVCVCSECLWLTASVLVMANLNFVAHEKL